MYPPPPRLESGKAWHGLSKNQGATGAHDEQYQMLARILMSFGLKQIDGIHHYNCYKPTFDHHRLSFDIPDMDNQVEESMST